MTAKVRALLTHPMTGLLGRTLLGGIFLYASLDKIAHPDQFAVDVANYRILPPALVNLLAVTLPWIEAVCGALLITGPFTRGSNLVMVGMLGMFVVAVGAALARDLDIECGCFSTSAGRRIGMKLLIQDLGLMALSIGIFVFDGGAWSLDRFLSRPGGDRGGPRA